MDSFWWSVVIGTWLARVVVVFAILLLRAIIAIADERLDVEK